MIYSRPEATDAVDQADLIDLVPLLEVHEFHTDDPSNPVVGCTLSRVLVLTQTCDLAQRKANRVTVARVLDANDLVAQGFAKATDVRGPIRSARVWGLYFLPAWKELGLSEMIVDLRQVHCVPLIVLETLCRTGHRRARLQPLYREHLAKHFADTYSRIGLPMSYETE